MDKIGRSVDRKRKLVNSQETGELKGIPQRKMKRVISSDENPEKPCHALELLPMEVWAKILEYLQEPNDILNCARVCSSFRADLQKRICDIMFYEVFQVFLLKGELPLTERLNLRLVCTDLAKLVIHTDHDLDRIIQLKTQSESEHLVLRIIKKIDLTKI